MKDRNYYVYIMTNRNNVVLYTGVTNDLYRRVFEHRKKIQKSFTEKYNVTKLVYYEATNDVEAAIVREKQIKAGSRAKKIALIERVNRDWADLSEGW